ncbi:putative fatty acyl-CoA reductase CG5065-like protein [Dinothrombium tinctorium]|uniref:Fatty acyl-CoA reductase n=1 Tax=Dinothrombium tinctorium TaxID=1965070 RepID=A0A443RH74_9ACAR|nr:putative fatty acyl-CoA reductase CG5065-like protein [Dinothrombium tinctorium]
MGSVNLSESEIIRFFSGQNLLITGALGSCGRIFLEKILRTVTSVGTIFLLIRPKFNLTPEQRFQRLFRSTLFKFHSYSENQLSKIVIVEGDITQSDLALRSNDAKRLRESVNIVFHIAASVNFAVPFSPKEAKFYNLVSSSLNRQRIPENYELLLYGIKLLNETPSIYMIRPTFTPQRTNNHNPTLYKVKRFFYHTVFAVLIDALLTLCRQKPILCKAVRKMHTMCDAFKFFANNEWQFQCDNFKSLIESLNETDSKLFKIDVRKLDFYLHTENSIKFARRYVLNESEKNVFIARIKFKM